jgi:sortase (surface protein transpeptidase)
VRRRRTTLGQWRWPFLTVAALAISVVAFVGASTAATPREVTLATSNSVVHESSAVKLPSTRRSAPLKLVIPAIGVSTSVGKLGLQPDDEVMVPTTIHTVGWYIDGPSPGQEGSAVILGHVDSYKGVGVFFNLKSLKAGDLITVTSSDGVVTRFSVTRVVQYSKSSFPDQLVYGPHGTRSLQLVTCGGVFDHATGHYESNIVVFSQLVKVSAPTSASTS